MASWRPLGRFDSFLTTSLLSNSYQNLASACLISGEALPILVMKAFACLKLDSAPNLTTSSAGGLMKGSNTEVLAVS